ncbi:hypothetical protein [uncultured Oscillibacter sp.]|uniref:hypothetical protein n=1 Tax=uncultured Oscillibacter sp. TaxID=876091 RepID=UPI0025EC5FF6|nr:hypothetical protein [uncultured Oscillibacter sp.]
MKTLLRYRLTDDLRSAGAALAAVVGVNILMVLFTNDRVYGSGTGAAMAFWALVVGIAALRADLRLGNQMGVCRREAFTASVVGTAVSCAAAAVGVAAVTAAGQLLTDGGGRLEVMEPYQMVYAPDTYVMPLSGYAAMAVFCAALYLCAAAFGMLCSAAFWRASRAGKWALGIGMGAAFGVGIPQARYRFGPALERPLELLLSNQWAADAAMLAFAAVFLGGTALLVRRAAIVPASR